MKRRRREGGLYGRMNNHLADAKSVSMYI